MRPLNLQEVTTAINGRWLSTTNGGLDSDCASVCINSREMSPAALFIAIKGENHDGHAYLNDAATGGAIAAIVQDIPANPPRELPLIHVENTRAGMGLLANHVRRNLKGAVIGVAGSNGKTSTKYLIDAALSGVIRGTISPKSFNNDIGVPLSIFAANPAHDYLVLEMGTNHPGEIRNLAHIAEPNVAVITSIGAEHLEFLGNLDGVRQENASIIEGMPSDGTLVVNGDDAGLREAVADFPGTVLSFGFNASNRLFATQISCDDQGVRFRLNGSGPAVFVPMLGRHTVANALAAIAAGQALGVSDEAMIEGLSRAQGPEWRLQMQEFDGISILNDAYNANPNSMQAALETVRELPTEGRRIAILGDMRELGPTTDRYHRELGEFAASCNLDLLCCVGDKSQSMAAAAERAGMAGNRVIHFTDAAACAKIADRLVKRGDLVLLKASRGIHLEKVAAAIQHAAETSRPLRVSP